MDPRVETKRVENRGEETCKNVELWQRLDAAQARHNVMWEWVKGHAGHPENERADALARAGMEPYKPK